MDLSSVAHAIVDMEEEILAMKVLGSFGAAGATCREYNGK